MRISFALAAVLAAPALLVGCSTQPRDSRSAFEGSSEPMPASPPMAQLPAAAGDQISVLQSNVDGLLVQKIVLRGDDATGGENRVTVSVDIGTSRPGESDWKAPKPTEQLIAKEIDDNLPGINMTISQVWTRNNFGPFGYAIGHAYGGVTCIYAWQWSAGQAPRLFADPVAQSAAASMPVSPTAVRVRLCKTGYGEAELVEMVRQMAVYAPGGATPFIDTAYGPAPLTSGDALSSSGVPGGFYLGARQSSVGGRHAQSNRLASQEYLTEEPIAPRAHHRHARRHARRHHHRVALRDTFAPAALAPAPINSVNVPLPGADGGAISAASNPLLAPLQASLATSARKSAPADLPLPPAQAKRTAAAAAPAATAAAAPAPAPAPAPIPLPLPQ